MCVFYVETLCACRFGLGWAYDDISVAHHMIMHFSCIHTIIFSLFGITVDWSFSVCFSLSLPLSRTVCAWHLSANSFRPGTLFVLGHLLLTLLHSMSSSVMIKPAKTFQRTSPNVGFIRNAMLSYQTSLIPLFPLSFIVGVRSLFVRSRWVVPSWSYRSFTLICTDLIILYLISSLLFEVSV